MRALVALCLAWVALAAVAVPVSAKTVYTHPYLGSFNGSGSATSGGSAGPFVEVDHLSFDQANQSLYALDGGGGYGQTKYLYRFDPAGNPKPFSALGAGVNAFTEGCPYSTGWDVAVDNSTSPTQGRFYASDTCSEEIKAYGSDGSQVPGFQVHICQVICSLGVDPQGNVWEYNFGQGLRGYDSTGASLGKTYDIGLSNLFDIDNSQPPDPLSGYIVAAHNGDGGPHTGVYDANGNFVRILETEKGEIRNTAGQPIAHAAGVAIDPVTHHAFVSDQGFKPHIAEFDASGNQAGTFGYPSQATGFGGVCPGVGDVAYNTVSGIVYVTDCNRIDIFGPGQNLTFPTVATDAAEAGSSSVVLHGHVDADNGGDITDCRFEWDQDEEYDYSVPCDQGTITNGDGNVAVTATVPDLLESKTYHFRVVATNANGPSFGEDRTFRAMQPPTFERLIASDIKSDGGTVSAIIDPQGSQTTYAFEWGTDTSYGHKIPVPDGLVPPFCDPFEGIFHECPNPTEPETISQAITGLTPGTTYHYRLVAHNDAGDLTSADRSFTTFQTEEETIDPCANALVRKQTRAAKLLDCRAYELVSSANAGGYDVESDLIPGQTPYPGYPEAGDRVLYSVHHGGIPGVPGDPPNFGLDPYLATRTADGWVTSYVGLPSDATPSTAPFSSAVSGADSALETFAFGGPSICSPCFSDGSGGIPLRLPDGGLVQGMAGSLDPGPGATPAGHIGRQLSADGTHLVFGSTAKFEPDGNSNGDLTIYDRDLRAAVTHVVSKTTLGTTMTGEGIGELDISADGSRIVIGRQLNPGAPGERLWHLYMNVGDASQTVDLTPGVTSGVLYDGMTSDGSKVFFSTADQLVGSDSDSSIDIYQADLSSGGAPSLSLVSTGTGGAGNSDACNPLANSQGPHWNSAGPSAGCGALAFAGSAGVAAGDGTIFFLSPETLDGGGTPGAPNLFVRRPGSAPNFVTTLEPDDPAILHAVADNETHRFSDFQVTSSGTDAVFGTRMRIADFDNLEHLEIYRYDTGTESLDCVSCAMTGAASVNDAPLSSYGSNLTSDGRVFFTSSEQLVLRDTNHGKDAYEWDRGVVDLVSTGTDSTDSGFLSVSADGLNAYFFTRSVLVPQDENGSAMKLYDARARGGFFSNPSPVPCQASDECHGPGTATPPPPPIASVAGEGGNFPSGGAIHHKKRHHRHHRRHRRHHSKRHGGH